MQKVLAILEGYVEFIALGLGAVFLGAMAWWYLVQTPVTLSVGGQDLRPGEIDAATVHGPVDVLERKVEQAKVPKVVVPDFKSKVHEALVPKEPPPMPTIAFNVLPGDAVIRLPDKIGTTGEQAIVKALPKIPAPEIADLNRGRTNVVMPPEGWVPGQPLPVVNLQPILNPVPNPAVPGAIPGRPGQPAPLINPATGRPNPGAVAPAAQQPAAIPAPVIPGQPAPPAPPVLADKDWVTVMYKLPMKAIAQAFTDVNIPQTQQLNLFKTCVLDVELIRQEIVDGKPQGEETVVKKLEISSVPPLPTDLAGELQYIGWASSNQGQIIQPGFFQIARGDIWMPPGVQPAIAMNPALNPMNQVFDPTRTYTPDELRKMTPQQIKAIRDYKEQQRKSKIRPTQRGTGGPADMIPPDEMSPEVPDLSRMQFAQALPPDMMEQLPPDEMGMEGGDQGDMGFQQPQMAPATFAQFPLPPNGEFDPRMAPDPTIGWAHDDTVEPGKSYRYKLRYKIKNPVFQVVNVAQPAALAAVFAITSPDSGWSQPVTIPPLTRFFVASLFNNKVSLEIFRWQNGQLHSTKVNVSPGDLITAKDASGIDYTTGSTLVDITVDPGRDNQPMIIVADPNGNLSRRDFKSDSNDPEYQKMKSLITAPVAQR
jgi:hypothetical protein